MTRYIEPEFLMRARAGDHPLPVWDAAIVVFHSRMRSRAILERLPGTALTCRPFSGQEEGEAVSALHHGRRIGILSSVGSKFGGGPLTVALVEELAVIGVRKVIGLGCAGSIRPGLSRGQQFVVSGAIPTDGASQHYLDGNPSTVQPDPQLLAIADSLTSVTGIRRVTGATVDAIYRETLDHVARWREAGAEVINMEITPFYAAARACGVSAVYVGHVSDELLGQAWKDWFGEDRDRMVMESADLAVHLLNRALGIQGP